MEPMTRGTLAKITGISSSTIRYYEDCHLLPKAKRLENGYRIYSEEYLIMLKFIKDAKKLGYTLNEIREILAMLNSKMHPEELKKLVQNKIENIEHKINDLRAMQELLASLLTFSDSDIHNYLDTFR